MKNTSTFQAVPIKERVRTYYRTYDFNCAVTTLKILAEVFSIDLSNQVIAAATGMHGAGKYGAQCGLVEGTLMFIGIIGKEQGMTRETITDQCRMFARQFEQRFGSLSCSILRPQGFKEEAPPHLCEPLSFDTVEFSKDFMVRFITENK